MSEPYLGQLSLVGFNFAPINWALAQGQILPISQNAALFSLLGTYYGGNGTSNFALPNLEGAVAVGFGQGPGLSLYDIGEPGGSQTVTLLASETPLHTHTASAKSLVKATVGKGPANNTFAEMTPGNAYTTSTSGLTQMNPAAISTYGSSLPHNNMMPYLGMYWIIAMKGVFPTRG
ncbi:MAG: tail fiber protein [Terracidiphilus sp.]|jgi:microcystin-dependent protein